LVHPVAPRANSSQRIWRNRDVAGPRNAGETGLHLRVHEGAEFGLLDCVAVRERFLQQLGLEDHRLVAGRRRIAASGGDAGIDIRDGPASDTHPGHDQEHGDEPGSPGA